MAEPIKKPRAEGDWYGVPIEDMLESGESTVATKDEESYPQVKILRYDASAEPGYTDVTDEFIESGQTDLQPSYATVTLDDGVTTKSGIRFYLDAAASDTVQDKGAVDYRVQAKFATDGDRKPVYTTATGQLPRLRIT